LRPRPDIKLKAKYPEDKADANGYKAKVKAIILATRPFWPPALTSLVIVKVY